MCFHECCEKVEKGKVRIVIELDVLKSWKRKRVGDMTSMITVSHQDWVRLGKVG